MSLWKQLCIVISLLFVFVFSGTFVISVNSMYVFLTTQMSSHAQDTASSLGISISRNLADNDYVTMERTVDAIFDRGYYKEIRVEDINGKIIYQNIFSEKINNAPDWFIAIIDVDIEEANALLMKGWKNIGKVYVASHPGYA